MPASGPPAREGAQIETLDGQVVGTAGARAKSEVSTEIQRLDGPGLWGNQMRPTGWVHISHNGLRCFKHHFSPCPFLALGQGHQWKHVALLEEEHLHRYLDNLQVVHLRTVISHPTTVE